MLHHLPQVQVVSWVISFSQASHKSLKVQLESNHVTVVLHLCYLLMTHLFIISFCSPFSVKKLFKTQLSNSAVRMSVGVGVGVCVCVCVCGPWWGSCIWMVTLSCIGVHSRDMLFLSPEFWKCLGCQIDMLWYLKVKRIMLSSDVTSPTICVSVKMKNNVTMELNELLTSVYYLRETESETAQVATSLFLLLQKSVLYSYMYV